MARQKSLINVEGSLGEFSFYSSVYGDIVRRKGGASKTMIRKSPKFKRLREHQAEFSNCASAGKFFRQMLLPYTLLAPDHTLVWRVTKLMNQLKDQDLLSGAGKRTVVQGLKSKAGMELLNGFELNSQALLTNVLKRPVEFDTGKILIRRLVSKRDLVIPKGASHVNITAIFSRLDLTKGTYLKEQANLVLKLDNKSRNIELQPTLPKGKNTLICALQLQFLKELEGQLFPLENKKANSLTVIGVE